jgi:hypothetical protein
MTNTQQPTNFFNDGGVHTYTPITDEWLANTLFVHLMEELVLLDHPHRQHGPAMLTRLICFAKPSWVLANFLYFFRSSRIATFALEIILQKQADVLSDCPYETGPNRSATRDTLPNAAKRTQFFFHEFTPSSNHTHSYIYVKADGSTPWLAGLITASAIVEMKDSQPKTGGQPGVPHGSLGAGRSGSAPAGGNAGNVGAAGEETEGDIDDLVSAVASCYFLDCKPHVNTS